MWSRIKRIVAREGLILICIIMLGCLFIFAPAVSIIGKKDVTPFTKEEFGMLQKNGFSVQQIALITKSLRSVGGHDPNMERIKQNVAKMVSMKAPEQDIDGYIQSEGVTIEDVRNYKLSSKYSGERIGYGILFLAYPFYLLLRFVFWAIWTLKRQDKGL